MNPGLVVLEVRAAVPGSVRATSLTDKSHQGEPHKDSGDLQRPWTGALYITCCNSLHKWVLRGFVELPGRSMRTEGSVLLWRLLVGVRL